jgi:universal stress protein E
MEPIRDILVIVDPTSQEQPAVAKGALLAELFGARVELFACDTKATRDIRHARFASNPRAAAFVADLHPMLELIAAPLRQRGLDVTIEAVIEDPLHISLVDRVRRGHAQLVIKDTHHHSLAQRTILTNTDWELIRGCPVSLLLVKPRPWVANHSVCAAVDPGHTDDKPALLDRCILEQAAAFAQALGAQLHVLHAYMPVALIASNISMPPFVADMSPALLSGEQERKRDELKRLVSNYRLPAENIHQEPGGVAEVLCRLATKLGADVMTMGAISRSAVKRAFVGSTAESVLERLPCDALVVKAPGFADQLA